MHEDLLELDCLKVRGDLQIRLGQPLYLLDCPSGGVFLKYHAFLVALRPDDLDDSQVSDDKAFPDLRAEVEDVFGEGDKILSRAMCKGTHKGELMGMPPTGKQIAIRVICADRFVDRKIAESHELPDMFGMMQQLGAIPKPG